MQPLPGTFIQIARAANQTFIGDVESDRNSLFTKYLLKYITRGNVDVTHILQYIANKVCRKSNNKQKPLSMDGLDKNQPIYLNEMPIPAEGKFFV